MMEVKQNTGVDLNDLLTSSNNSGTDEVDDALMTDITDRTHDLVNCDLIKKNDKSNTNIAELANGAVAMATLINDVDVSADLNSVVSTELEDALLAEDDVLPKIVNTKSSVADDILADKVETSNSTTSSSNVRDPGDDLDTLLSKINDIVEDCIDNDSENTVTNTLNSEQIINKLPETQKEKGLNESSLLVEKTPENIEIGVVEKTTLLDSLQSTVNNVDNQLELSTENVSNKDTTISAKVSPDQRDIANNLDIEENEKTEVIENNISVSEITNGKECIKKLAINDLQSNLNLDKTEETKAKIVQDNEINSKSNDIVEAVKTPPPSFINTDVDKILSPKVTETNEIDDATENKVDIPEKTSIDNDNEDKTAAKDAKTSDPTENEESDDEIVFFVDKPPETDKCNTTESKSLSTEKETTCSTENSQKEEIKSPEKKTLEDDDDVVLLLDDDDEDLDQSKNREGNAECSKKQEKNKGSEDIVTPIGTCEVSDAKDIAVDNSDNARDVFVTENSSENEKPIEKPAIAEIPEEINSNCSSSSNLLQETKSLKSSVDETTPEEAENEEDDDDAEVELIEAERKECGASKKVDECELAPPTKRLRLSEECEQSPKAEEPKNKAKELDALNTEEKKQKSQEIQEEENCSESISSTLKRTHDVIEIEADEKSNDSKVSSEGVNKKPRTEDVIAEANSSEKVIEVKEDKPNAIIKPDKDDKKDIKAVRSYEPIPLYPPPKFEDLKSESSISLEFLKKFRKSFDNMTKQDLEELVLQKVVESIIHRSEFSEMRELIEKQEKLITAHRSKISELSKQFRDLEMVHNRVVKDIEQRNSQFIMPVKITRAVGLQVYIPNKKSLTETASSSTGHTVPSSPQRNASSQASTSSTSLTSPQRQFLASQVESQTQSQSRSASSVSTGPVSTVRRGCVQKITPIRPVPGANQPSPVGPVVASASYRNAVNHSASAQPRILNKNATTTTNASAVQRSRYMGSTQDSQRMPTQQQAISRTPNIPANSQRVGATVAAQSKTSPNVTVQRRSEPLTQTVAANSTSSIVDNYINTLTHLTGGNTAVSITPAKPKEKAVIDLTDEDEIPGQTANAQPATQIPVTQVPRRSLPGQNTNSQLQYGRAAPPLARIPPANSMANNKSRQIASMQAQKNGSFTAISTPPGTSITRINVPQNNTTVQRVKYSHPAPLPATPPQAFNPSWKLPPPRPTIRISNLDNGIVISWTMEESMDRHAECVSYQIYAYQETTGPPMVDSWRHVGDVKAMLLPMAVTLTQFQEGQRYYFAVRAVDCHQRFGPFSLPKTWS